MRRPLLAMLVLGACATTPVYDPCACVIMPDYNGLTSLTLGREVLSDNDGAQTFAIEGRLFFMTEGGFYSASGVELIGNETRVVADWANPTAPDLTTPATITELRVSPPIPPDDYAGNSYSLGPRGGSVTLREIAPGDGGGWRVRGRFVAEVCLDGADRSDCRTTSGNFAFDAPILPPGAEESGLMVSG